MIAIDPMLLERAWASALPGKESVTLNEALRAITAAVRPPAGSSRYIAGPSADARVAGTASGVEIRLDVGNTRVRRREWVQRARQRLVFDLGQVNGDQRSPVIRLLARQAQPLHKRSDAGLVRRKWEFQRT